MDAAVVQKEFGYKAVRSGGAGGQHVNKVSSKVVVTFNVPASQGLSDDEKVRIAEKLANRVNASGQIILTADDDRSQLRNKAIATQRLLELLEQALVIPKKRRPTKIPRAVVEKRLKEKRSQSEIKSGRKKLDY